MARDEIRDGGNRLVGWRQQQGDRIVGYDGLGRIKGSYEPRLNMTKDHLGRLVSRSDTLIALIMARS
jgi:hypothetical protein